MTDFSLKKLILSESFQEPFNWFFCPWNIIVRNLFVNDIKLLGHLLLLVDSHHIFSGRFCLLIFAEVKYDLLRNTDDIVES